MHWATWESPVLVRLLCNAKVRRQAVTKSATTLAYFANVLDAHKVFIAGQMSRCFLKLALECAIGSTGIFGEEQAASSPSEIPVMELFPECQHISLGEGAGWPPLARNGSSQVE